MTLFHHSRHLLLSLRSRKYFRSSDRYSH